METGRRGGDIQLIHTHRQGLKIRKNISAVEVPSEEQGVPAHIRLPRTGFPCMKEKCP